MDQIFNKVGSYWVGQKANKQFDSVGKDINVRSPRTEYFVFLFSIISLIHLIDFDSLVVVAVRLSS